MIYLGEGKTVIEYKDKPFETNDYYRQETEDLHVALLDINEGTRIKTFDAGWRLCGDVSETEIFLEKERKIIKVDVTTGEVKKKYSTEALWQQAYIDQSKDELGLPFHTYPIVWTSHEGKLYAKNTGGIFCLDEKAITWKQCVAPEKGDFKMGPTYNNTFRVLSDHKALIMGYASDGKGATDSYIYEWK